MSITRKKLFLPAYSIFIVVIFFFGCGYFIYSLGTKNSSEKFPIRTLLLQIDKDKREELFVQLRQFSEKNDLEFHLSFYKNGEVFFVEIYGDQLEILAQSIPGISGEIRVDIYEANPSKPPSQETVNKLYDGLKEFINQIPNLTIIEEK